MIVDLDFSELGIKGRQSQGNLFSRYPIHKIVLKEKGVSTLAGQNIWWDEDVRRLNSDGRGTLIGEFKGNDKIVVWTAKNLAYITGFDTQQHFPDDTLRVERYVPGRIYNVCYFDKEQGYFYMKRFQLEQSDKMQYFLDEDGSCRFECISGAKGAKLELTYKGAHENRPADIIDVEEFVGVKSCKAKGKRLTTFDVATLTFIEPEIIEPEEPEDEPMPSDVEVAESIDEGAEEFEEFESVNTVQPVDNSGVPIEIIRNDIDESNSEQLNLF
jgi:topoisomerase-4 subunit A